jgi:hypothetical protein
MLKIKEEVTSLDLLDFRKSSLKVWGYTICIFLLSMPYFMWNLPVPPEPFLLLFCLLLSISEIRVSRKNVAPILGIICLYTIVVVRGGFTIFGIGSTLLILPIFILDKEFLSKVFHAYSILFSITIIPSIIIFVLVIFLGFEMDNNLINPLNISKEGDYLQYPFLVLYRDIFGINPRFYGYYDEPGVIGTIAGVLLIVKKVDLKNRFNIPIFIAGILSLSFFFFIVITIYILLFEKIKYKLVLILLCAFLLFFFYSNELLYTHVFRRFEFGEEGLVGDNRMDIQSREWYENFKNSSDYLFGIGGYSNWRENYHGASYKELIINYGLIFLLLYITNFSFLAMKNIKRNKELSIYILVLLSILYQRPFIADMLYVFLLFSTIYALSRESKSEFAM